MENFSDIARAAKHLQRDELVAFPTETVYGLGGNALSDAAAAKIFDAKGRPRFNPLIVHVRSLADAVQYGRFNATARKLAEQYWPGPLTLVVPRTEDCKLSLLVSAGLDTVALRSPAHPLARALLEESRLPLAAPSANRSGRVSPTEAAHVKEELADHVAMILDGGRCDVGIESTVIDATGEIPVVLRPGSIVLEGVRAGVGGKIVSPGMLESHYAPEHRLRLNATEVSANEALLAFCKPIPGVKVVENLSEKGDLKEAAANLFRMLRLLDKRDISGIAVMPVPETGLGIAINDRLKRAAADKNPSV
jgi:L-threonylcarbamoyladenylate synthase